MDCIERVRVLKKFFFLINKDLLNPEPDRSLYFLISVEAPSFAHFLKLDKNTSKIVIELGRVLIGVPPQMVKGSTLNPSSKFRVISLYLK